MEMWSVDDYKDKPTLRDLRKERCMSVGEIARAMEVRENTVYRWERGFNVPPLIEALKLAILFKTEVSQVNWWPYPVDD
jgi:predicted transcriptional regulator